MRKPLREAPSDRPLRAGLYLRQSINLAEGIERQLLRCTQLAEARGYEISATYEDNDTSASKVRGPKTAWARLLADLTAGRADVVIAVDLDRLLRNTRDLATLIDTGALVLTVDGEIDLTTADGEFRATMLASMARFEVRRKSERQIRANDYAASKGIRTGGRRPFGYEHDGVTVIPAEAAAIVNGYRDFLLGVPLAAIARSWNAAGFVTGQGRRAEGFEKDPSPWHAYSARMVLANPRYKGMRTYHGRETAPAQWTAIVDEPTWGAVAAILDNPSRRRPPNRGRYLLSGLALCGVCDAPVHAGGNARAGVPAYRCGGSLGHFARMSAPVDEFIGQLVVARLSAPDATRLTAAPTEHDTTQLRLDAVVLRQRRDALAAAFARGDFDDDTDLLAAAGKAIAEQLVAIDEKLADSGRVEVLGSLIGAPDVASVWADLSTDRKRAVIDELAIVRLHPVGRGTRTFRPETVGIEWRAE